MIIKVKTLRGCVLSSKMHKSAVIVIERFVRHPMYQKFIKKKKKIHIHDENNICSNGDIVEISECRPVSRTKSWVFVKIIKKFVL
ncbi:30S ribosomal protein S17 [Buchnera aphidicola]|uniref:30S ribosomal protein S17 n=1 Tax=Buchnera aphidicola TaxID=9 RepID=UPI00346471E8